jgi:hypothetical protein
MRAVNALYERIIPAFIISNAAYISSLHIDIGPSLTPPCSSDRSRLFQNGPENVWLTNIESHAMFHSAMSVEALALSAGLNPLALHSTVDDYNRRLQEGREDAFGRKMRPAPLSTPPYYSIAMQGWTLVSFAGLKVSVDLQVLRKGGEAVPNLYAIGEVIGAGATSGAAYTNGMLVTPAITFGRILGTKLARASLSR